MAAFQSLRRRTAFAAACALLWARIHHFHLVSLLPGCSTSATCRPVLSGRLTMSAIENFQKLFKPKSDQPEDSMDMGSVGTPGDPLATVAIEEEPANNADVHQVEAGDDIFAPGRMATAEDEMEIENPDLLALPLLGHRTMGQHQRILVTVLVLAVAALGIVTFLALNQAGKVAQQLEATGQSLMQSQRLAKSVSQALVGSAQAFPEVRESADVMAKSVRGLKAGDATLNLAPVTDALQTDVDKVVPMVDRAEKNAKTVMAQQGILTQVGNALRTINRQSS